MRMVFLVASSLAASSHLSAAEPASQARIVVEGFGVVQTPPQVANIDYQIRGEGKTSDEAAKALVQKAKRIENALRSIDPAVEPRSESVTFSEVRGADCKSERYDDIPRLSVGPCAVVGYFALQKVSVKTALVRDAGTMVGLASSQGATDPELESFGLLDRARPKQEAIAAALADARTKAQAIAESSGVALGPIINVTLDRAQGDQEIVVTGSKIRSAEMMQVTSVRIEMVPKFIETNAQVTITFGITR